MLTGVVKLRTDGEIYEKLMQTPPLIILPDSVPNFGHEMVKIQLLGAGSFLENSTGSSPGGQRGDDSSKLNNDSKSTGSSRSNSPASGSLSVAKRINNRRTVIDAGAVAAYPLSDTPQASLVPYFRSDPK